jgi:DNA-binding transcriptional MerR regulator
MGTKTQMSAVAKIGQAAREAGVSIDTIRFYEKQGLLKSFGRTQGGFRLFGEQEIEELKFIQKAQELGFSLAEVRELLLLQRDGMEACEHVRDLLEQKIAQVRSKVEELRKLEVSLKRALRQCERNLDESAREHECCPVLEKLGRKGA